MITIVTNKPEPTRASGNGMQCDAEGIKVPIDYERAKKNGPKLKAALTKAGKITDPEQRFYAVKRACTAAVQEWNLWGAWPDAWSLWQRALDGAYFKLQMVCTMSLNNERPTHCPRLEEL